MKSGTKNNFLECKSEGKRVAIGLSGGVDSAVSAALLVEQGYEVTGVFLECWSASAEGFGETSARRGGCKADEDRKDALSVALKLAIPFEVLDFKKEYKDRVVEYFYREYKAGRTPNPDAMCNREIKFGMFYEWALINNFDFVATGHYARVLGTREVTSNKHQVTNKSQKSINKSQTKFLVRGVDSKKDQSYFLYQLRPEQLEHILFPIGEMHKGQVRKEAKRRGLPVADKVDSQGICFIGEINVRKFLEERIEPKKGEVVDTKGNVVGEHDGVWFYTIGQRSGFRIKQDKLGEPEAMHVIPPFYVVEKQVKKNRLVVGFGAETYKSRFEVEDFTSPIFNYPARGAGRHFSIFKKEEVFVRIRHGGALLRASIKCGVSSIKVNLEEAQRGVAPGQSAVFYLPSRQAGDDVGVVLGGGVIV